MLEGGQLLVSTQGDLEPHGVLPVRVRTAQGALVASGVTGKTIALPDGEYEISIVKPDMIEFEHPSLIKVQSGEAETVLLGNLASAETASPANYTPAEGGQPTLQQDDADQELPAAKIINAKLWRGRWMDRWESIESAYAEGLQPELVALRESESVTLASDHEDDRFLVTPYDAQGKTILRFSIVPHDECVACVGVEGEEALISATLRPGKAVPTIRYRSLRSDEANALLDFVESGVLSDMQDISAPMIERGAAGMLDAQFSLLRGTLGAYVMLRANNVKKLEPWLAEMIERAPGLSDIRIMRAELLGRLGRHSEAVNEIKIALISLCPWFRSGISYLLERLRLYLEIEDEDKATLPMTEVDWEVFAFAKLRLQNLSPFLVPGNLFTTFDIPE
jgi:hypothetical protein